MTERKVMEGTDESFMTYRALCEGLEADPDFPQAALEELKQVDPDSTCTLATSAGRLLNHWTVQRELQVYERGRVVDDVTKVTLYADENDSYEAAERAVEQCWNISRTEFSLLLLKRDMAVPGFLRSKTPSAPDTTYQEDSFGWTVLGAARELHRRYGVDENAMAVHLASLVSAGRLPLVNPKTGLHYASPSPPFRDFWDRFRASDLDGLFLESGASYRLSESTDVSPPLRESGQVKWTPERRANLAKEHAKLVADGDPSPTAKLAAKYGVAPQRIRALKATKDKNQTNTWGDLGGRRR